MSKIKKNIQREKFENTNFEIIYDINYTKQSVTCTLIPKPDFINKLNNRADKVFKGVIGFEVYSQYLLKNIDNKYIGWEFDKSNSFDVEKCKAAAYRSATEYMNNDWHNTTLKMQKLIAAKMLDVSRVYTSYSSTMLKRAADRLKLKASKKAVKEENASAAEIADDAKSFIDKTKNTVKNLFTK